MTPESQLPQSAPAIDPDLLNAGFAPSLNKTVRGAEKLQGVQPDLLNHWNNLQGEFDKVGLQPEIKSGFRTAEQQNALFRNPATSAKTKGHDGYVSISPHQRGEALDISFPLTQRAKGRQIIADYAQRNNLQVPSDEPWHVGLAPQKQTLDPDLLNAGFGQEPQTPNPLAGTLGTYQRPPTTPEIDPDLLAAGRGAGMARAGQVAVMRGARQTPSVDWSNPSSVKAYVENLAGPKVQRAVARQQQAPVVPRLGQVPTNTQAFLHQEGQQPMAEDLRSQIARQVESEYGSLAGQFQVPLTDPTGAITKSRERMFNEEVDRRVAAAQRANTPEIVAARKELGATPAVVRGPVAAANKFGGGVVRSLSGLTSVLGIAPNKLSDFLEHRAQVLTEGSDAPLNEQGELIKRSLPEKASEAVTSLGLTIAQLVLLKKATGLGLGDIMAAETALQTSKMPMRDRAAEILKSKGMGEILDQHLSRPLSAALFGGPTAIQSGLSVTQGTMSLEDALLQTGVQTGAGAVLGGKPKSEPVAESRTIVPDITAQLAAREAAIKPVTDAQGNVLLNADEVAQNPNARPKIRLAQRGGDEAITQVPAPSRGEISQTEPDATTSERSSVPSGREFVQRTDRTTQSAIARTESVSEVAGTVDQSEFAPTEQPVRHVDLQPRTPEGQFDQETPAQAEARREQVASVTPQPDLSTQAQPATSDARKELWQQSKTDYMERANKSLAVSPWSEKNDPKWVRDWQGNQELRHKNAVRAALKDGKPVPPEVLADYPDLAKQYAAQPAIPDTANVTPQGADRSASPVSAAELDAAMSGSKRALELLGPRLSREQYIDAWMRRNGIKQTAQGDWTVGTSTPPYSRTVSPKEIRMNRDEFGAIYDKIVKPQAASEVAPMPKSSIAQIKARIAAAGESKRVNKFLEMPEGSTARAAALKEYDEAWDRERRAEAELYFARGGKLYSASERKTLDARWGSLTSDEREGLLASHRPDAADLYRDAQSAPPVPPTSFKTSQGSVYTVSGESTQRTKSLHQMHDPKDVGLKQPSQRTVYVSPDEATKIGAHGTLNTEARPRVELTNEGIVLTNKYGRGWAQTKSEVIPYFTSPEVGKAPVEFWERGKYHAGNAITEVTTAPPVPEGKGQPDVSRAEPLRTPLASSEGSPRSVTLESGKPSGNAINRGRESGRQGTTGVGSVSSGGVDSKPPELTPEGKLSEPEVSGEISPTTSIKHAVVEAERELKGLPQFTKARRSHGESFDQGVSAVRNGDIDPRALAASIVKEPRPLSTKESMALLYDRMRISNAKEAAAADLQSAVKSGDEQRITDATEKVKQIDDASNANDEAAYRAGSEQGRGLAIRRELINRDYSRAVVTAKLRARNRGKVLPGDIQTKVDDLTSRLEEANKRIDDLEAKSGEKQSLAQTDKFVREYKLKLRQQSRARTREVLAAERADLKQQFAAEFRAQKPKSSTLSMGGLGDLDPEGKLSKIAVELARNYIEDGVTKASDIVDAVHGHLKDVADLTKREVGDLISGYGRIKQSVSDPIEKKLGEVRSILASTSGKADVLEKGIRPLRRGQQREKPTEDQRRALRDLQDAMREQGPKLAEKPYNVETEQATPLDKAKTTTRNRIEQLKQWIVDGKREVQGRGQVIPDNELDQLKTEQAALEKVASLISDPAADQKAIERRLTELTKSISDSRAAIQSGKLKLETKEGAKSLWSPEIGATEKERATLRQIVTDMRSDAARKVREAPQPKASFYGATGSWAEYEAEARKTLNAQKTQARNWEKKVSDLQNELAAMKKDQERPAKTERKPTPETNEVRVAKRNAQVLQSQIDQLGNVIDWQNKNIGQKALAYTAAGVRAGLLTGTRTIGKIGSALGQSAVQQYGGEAAREGAGKLFPRTSALAPRHGQRIGAESEGQFVRGVGQGIKDIPRALKSGETSLTLEAGKRYPQIPTKAGAALALPGRVHMAEKNILGSGEKARAETMNLQWAKKQGMDVNSPDVKQWAQDAAHKHAEEIMMLGDNPFSRFIQWGRRSMSKEGQDISRIAVPVERVPSNYLFAQLIGEYGLGLPRGLVRGVRSEYQLRKALRSAIADTSEHYMDGTLVEAAKELERRNPGLMGRLNPEEADKTMRLLKRGSVGLVYITLGATAGAGTGAVAFGGYYGGAGDKKEVKPGDVKIGPVTIPHWALHSPPNELGQFASTIKREVQSQVANDKTIPLSSRVKTGLAVGAKGVVRQVPFLNEYADAVASLRSGDEMSTQAGKWLAARVEPQIMQELARATDREETENKRRKAKGFTEAMKLGIPGLRETVPINEKPSQQEARATAINEMRKGNIPADDELRSQGFTSAQIKDMKKDAKLTSSQVAFSNAQPDQALDRYERMSEFQRYQVQKQMEHKAFALRTRADYLLNNAKDDDKVKRQQERDTLQKRFDDLGISPRDPKEDRETSNPFKVGADFKVPKFK